MKDARTKKLISKKLTNFSNFSCECITKESGTLFNHNSLNAIDARIDHVVVIVLQTATLYPFLYFCNLYYLIPSRHSSGFSGPICIEQCICNHSNQQH